MNNLPIKPFAYEPGLFGEIKRAVEAAQEFDVDGVIFNWMFNCRPMAILSHLLKQFVERETGIPVDLTPFQTFRTYQRG